MASVPLVFADSLPQTDLLTQTNIEMEYKDTPNVNIAVTNASKILEELDYVTDNIIREPLQLASRNGIGIVNIEMRESIEETKNDINSEQTNDSVETENSQDSQEYISMEVPSSDYANTGFKSFMDYRSITSTGSAQYKLQQDAITNDNGFRVYDNCYMVAMGTYYINKIGDKFRITLEDDTVIYVVAGDVKSDIHTDPKHQHKNGNIIEFIVDTHKISKTCRKMGDMSYAGLEGKIKSIERIVE